MDTDFDPLRLPSLGTWAISTFQRCPLRYHFRYRENRPERSQAERYILDDGIRRAIRHHFEELRESRRPPTFETLLSCFRAYVREQLATSDDSQRDSHAAEEVASRMLRAFQGSALARPSGEIVAIEAHLRGPIVAGCPDIVGRAPLVINSGDHLEVIAFRTSRASWRSARVEEEVPQMVLSCELVRLLVADMPIRATVAVLTKAKLPTLSMHEVPIDVHAVERTHHIVRQVWKAINSGHAYPAPSSISCSTCPFQEPCQAWPAQPTRLKGILHGEDSLVGRVSCDLHHLQSPSQSPASADSSDADE